MVRLTKRNEEEEKEKDEENAEEEPKRYYITPYWEKELEKWKDVEDEIRDGQIEPKGRKSHKKYSKRKGKTAKKKTTSKTWSFDSPTIEKCPTEDEDVRVIINKSSKHKIEALMDTMGSDEWLGLLKGQELRSDNKGWIVKDIYIPEQKVTGSSAVKKENGEPEDVFGIIHSHHSMGTFWSGTDEKHANSNFDVSLVVDSDMNIKGICKVETPCGKRMHIEPDIDVINEYDKMLEWADEMKDEKIKKKTYTTGNTRWAGYGGYNSYYRNNKSKKKSNKKSKDKSKKKSKNKIEWEECEDGMFRQKRDSKKKDKTKKLDPDDVKDISDSYPQPIQLEKYTLTENVLKTIVKKCKDIPCVILGNTLDFESWLLVYESREIQDNWTDLDDEVKLQIIKDYLIDVRDWFTEDYELAFLKGVYESEENES